jgi:hypothetical protein
VLVTGDSIAGALILSYFLRSSVRLQSVTVAEMRPAGNGEIRIDWGARNTRRASRQRAVQQTRSALSALTLILDLIRLELQF